MNKILNDPTKMKKVQSAEDSAEKLEEIAKKLEW